MRALNLYFLFLLLFAFSCTAQNDLEEVKKEIVGIWEIVSYKPGTISALTEEQSQEYIGKRIAFRRTTLLTLTISTGVNRYIKPERRSRELPE